jgi:hypothetical protein
VLIAAVQGFGQPGLALTEVPYSESYLRVLKGLQSSFSWVYEKPATPIPDTANVWQKWRVVENFSFGKDRGSLPMIADLQSLHPYFRDQIIELIAQCKKKGVELAVVEAYRTHAKQNEYKSMGKKYTRSAGGHSKHQYGLAVDVVPVVDSVAQWNNHALWKKVGLVGERLGLRWGGRWRHPYDPGHFEWTGGLSSYHLAQGKFPSIPPKHTYPCVEEDLASLQKFWGLWETEQSALVKKNRSGGKNAMK